MFENVIMVIFKSVFYLKYIKIIFFLFFKNYFWYQYIKIIWKYKKHINFFKKQSIIKVLI
jgi:hypothetical protein